MQVMQELFGRCSPRIFSGKRFLVLHRPILKRHLHSQVLTRSRIMGKEKQSTKEVKKQPAMTPKEKKAAKQAKKHAPDVIPMTPR